MKPDRLIPPSKSPEAIGETLKRTRGRPNGSSEDREVLVAYLSDFAREFRDQAPLRISVTRALNLLDRSGISLERFIAQLYQARSLTKEQTASITKTVTRDGSSGPVKSSMAYFFAVLEDLLGLRDAEASSTPR